MKRTRHSSSSSTRDIPMYTPLHVNEFTCWPELLPEMQGCITDFLDNGSRQMLSITCTNALKRWYVFMPSDCRAWIKKTASLLAEDGCLCYIKRFLKTSVTTRHQLFKRFNKCISYLVKWNRWKNNDVTDLLLEHIPYRPLSTPKTHHEFAFTCAIKWSNFECMDWIFSEGHIDDFFGSPKTCQLYRTCGRYGNILALKRVIDYDLYSNENSINEHAFCAISENLKSKPRHAFEWHLLFNIEPFRAWWKINYDSINLADIIAQILGLEGDDSFFHFDRIGNCHALWKLFGPNVQRDVREIWSEFNRAVDSLSSVQLFESMGIRCGDTMRDGPEIDVTAFLAMAEEMGFSPHMANFYNREVTEWPLLYLAAEASLFPSIEVYCQWLISHGALDLRDPSPETFGNIHSAICSTIVSILGSQIRSHPDNITVISRIRHWFASHTFEGVSILREIIDEVLAHPVIRLIMERKT